MPYKVDRIEPAKTALIVVDMENDFVAVGAPMETPAGRVMLPTLKRAIEFCRERGIHVICLRPRRQGQCALGAKSGLSAACPTPRRSSTRPRPAL